MKRTKRYLAAGLAVVGIAGAGTMAVVKGPEFLGKQSTAAEADATVEANATPVTPIALLAGDAGAVTSATDNPLRNNDNPIVRGNDDSPSLPPVANDRFSGLPSAPPPFSAHTASTGQAEASSDTSLTPPPSVPPVMGSVGDSPAATSPAAPAGAPVQNNFAAEPAPLTPAMPTARFDTQAEVSAPATPHTNQFDNAAVDNSHAPAVLENRFNTQAEVISQPPSQYQPPAQPAMQPQADNVGFGTRVASNASLAPLHSSVDGNPAGAGANVNTGVAATTNARPGMKELDGTQTPSLAIEKFAPSEIQIGKPAKFQVKIRNVGQATAHSVMVHDQVPQGTKLIDTTPPATTLPSGALVWELGNMSPGEEQTVALQVMPTAEGEIGSVASVTMAAQASVRVKSTRPKLVLETSAPQKVLIGQDMVLSIRLSNPGSGAASHVILEEDVPEGLSHVGGDALEFDAGTLKPGETRQLELTMKADKAGKVINRLRARADANLSTESTAEIEIIAPELAIQIDGPNRRFLEREATHQIAVVNPGTAPAHNVEMVAHLPKGLKFVSTNNQGKYDTATHAVYWSLEQLSAGDQGVVALSTLPLEAGDQKIRVESKAAMNLAAEKEHLIGVDGLAALMFEVADAADPIEINGETLYEIRVLNQGSAAASNVRLAALLPPGLTPLEAKGPTTGAVSGQQVVFQPLRSLNAKTDATYTIRVKGVAPGNQVTKVQLVSDEIQTPVTEEESTRVYADQ